MLIAVTGATGLVGRYLIRHLLDRGHRCRAWYRAGSDRGGLPAQVEWCPGQLGQGHHELVRGVDAVVHAAVDWSERRGDIERFLTTNFMGSIRLMEAARQANVARFVYVSSCAVHEKILDDRPLDETHPCWPTSHYGAHKAALEKFVHSYGFGLGWNICSLRPTGIYGLDHPPARSRYFDLVGQVVRGEKVATARGGKEVHALDVARAIVLLLDAPAEAIRGEAFNCYDRYVSEQEVAQIARDLTGSKSPIELSNRGPKHQIDSGKIRQLGMTFGGADLLRQTVKELVDAHQLGSNRPT